MKQPGENNYIRTHNDGMRNYTSHNLVHGELNNIQSVPSLSKTSDV
jgi:hypothetical protein